jgi:hypothetical protein
MDIRHDEYHRSRTRVFDPMRSRTEFGEDLALTEFFGGAVVMVVGQRPGEQIDDRRVALMTVQTNMTAGCNRGAAETQLAVL